MAYAPARFRGAFFLPDPSERLGGPLPKAAAPAIDTLNTRRELLILLILLAFGLFAVPLLIWVIGNGMLGAYANGGAFKLLMDFFTGLKQGIALYWAIAIGPYVFIMLMRGLWHLMTRADSDAD